MSFNGVGQYAANFKVWDEVGNLIPDVGHSEGMMPHGEFMPASWLPVVFREKYFDNWMVIMPGKILALDNDGRVVPAQYGLAGATITYTADDVTEGTIDVRTGVALLTADIGTFTVASVTDHMGRGLGQALAVSDPVGVTAYPVLQWAGDGSAADDGSNPARLKKHNYNMQHRVALLCDYVLELPIVPSDTADENLTQDSFDANTNVATLAALSNLPVAANTVRTPITFGDGVHANSATRFVNQVAAVTDIKNEGDWHISLVDGVISVWSPITLGGGNVYTVSYSHYATAPTGANVSVFASVVGNAQPGDFLICNADSNWAVATTEDFKDIMGQVLDIEAFPRGGLERVRTAHASPLNTNAAGSHPGYLGQMDQMSGSATGGVTGKIHYAGAANLVARVNLVSR